MIKEQEFDQFVVKLNDSQMNDDRPMIVSENGSLHYVDNIIQTEEGCILERIHTSDSMKFKEAIEFAEHVKSIGLHFVIKPYHITLLSQFKVDIYKRVGDIE